MQEKILTLAGGLIVQQKAGVNMFTQCVATEESRKKKISSKKSSLLHLVLLIQICKHKFAKQIKKDFTNLDRFITLKEEGKLLSPEYVAKAIRNLLETEDFPQGEVIRIDE